MYTEDDLNFLEGVNPANFICKDEITGKWEDMSEFSDNLEYDTVQECYKAHIKNVLLKS